jgi:hypothetical protein
MATQRSRRSGQAPRRIRARGLTLIEVAVSMVLVVTIVVAAMAVRYHSVKQARRADAYNGAGRLALLLLEGWRSYATPGEYDPVAHFTAHLTIESGAGPGAPTGFTALGDYHIVFDHANYYVTLAYIPQTTTAPAKLHAAVAFREDYQDDSVATGASVVHLTTYD